MNKTQLMGRLTRDPEVRYTQGEKPLCIARYTLAVDRRRGRSNNNENNTDFIPCVVFGRSAEFTEKYLKKGMKIAVSGRIQTGSYTNDEGKKVFTVEVVVEDQEFAESKKENGSHSTATSTAVLRRADITAVSSTATSTAVLRRADITAVSSTATSTAVSHRTASSTATSMAVSRAAHPLRRADITAVSSTATSTAVLRRTVSSMAMLRRTHSLTARPLRRADITAVSRAVPLTAS